MGMDQDNNNKSCRGLMVLCLPRERMTPEVVEQFKARGEGRAVLVAPGEKEVEGLVEQIEIGFGDVPFSLVSRMPRLQWIQLWSAGADWLQQYPELAGLPFKLTTTSGMHRQQITEHVFGMLLAWNRRLPEAFACQSRHEWRKMPLSGLSVLEGKRMLILGYGAIGAGIARAALTFGMRVTGIRRSGPPVPREEEGVLVVSAAKLPDQLPLADVVVNILPLTDETRGSFGAAELAVMKKTALYVNVGRGATTDQGALLKALKSRAIAGALLDVTDPEPLPPDSPLWDLDNLLLTGHYAGFHPDYDAIALKIALDNLDRYVRGEPLVNLVDKTAGY
ncbi:MAG: D-2-hydroxyacid dehydrogenase [Spirochaetaceae bacterium]|jgi:phosphoglycerate dehydrogenase-like enzyme|nr:D-2-hydroxyacid dehydrogenase [Spirochaetaceae bacterium]